MFNFIRSFFSTSTPDTRTSRLSEQVLELEKESELLKEKLLIYKNENDWLKVQFDKLNNPNSNETSSKDLSCSNAHIGIVNEPTVNNIPTEDNIASSYFSESDSSLSLLKKGMTLEAISKVKGIQVSSVIKKITPYLKSGEVTVHDVICIDDEGYSQVVEGIKEVYKHEDGKVKPLFTYLKGKYSYDVLKVVLASLDKSLSNNRTSQLIPVNDSRSLKETELTKTIRNYDLNYWTDLVSDESMDLFHYLFDSLQRLNESDLTILCRKMYIKTKELKNIHFIPRIGYVEVVLSNYDQERLEQMKIGSLVPYNIKKNTLRINIRKDQVEKRAGIIWFIFTSLCVSK